MEMLSGEEAVVSSALLRPVKFSIRFHQDVNFELTRRPIDM